MNKRQIKKFYNQLYYSLGRKRKEYYRRVQVKLSVPYVLKNGSGTNFACRWDMLISRAIMHKAKRKYRYKKYYAKMLKLYQEAFPGQRPGWDET